MISLVSIVILSLSLLYFDVNRDPPNTVEKFGGEVFTGLGVFATGFVCHQIITPTLFSLPVRHALFRDSISSILSYVNYPSLILE